MGGGGAEINTTMKEIKVEKFDDLFKDAATVLQTAEDLRAGLQDSKAACMAISGAYTLKVGGMADALQCWMWSVGAECGVDKLSGSMKPKLDLQNEPHFNMEIDPAMSEQNKEFFEAFQCYVNAVTGAATQVATIVEKIGEVTGKGNELMATAKDDCAAAGLSAMDTAKAVAAIGSNLKTVATGSAKCTALGPVGAEALTDLTDLASKLAGMITDAAANCNEGKEKGAATAAEFCEKQHPGEKLDAKQSAKDGNITTYTKNKEAGKKLPSGKKADAADEKKEEEAAPAEAAAEDAAPAEAAPEAAVETADVKPEIKDV